MREKVEIGAECEFEIVGMLGQPCINGERKYKRLLIRQTSKEKVISLCSLCEIKKGSPECNNCEMEAYALVSENPEGEM
jgi:hypothetical protein